MTMRKVGNQGRVTIAKSIRDELHIRAGDRTFQRVEGGRIVIEILPGRHRRSLRGVLRDKVGQQPADESWSALRDAAWNSGY